MGFNELFAAEKRLEDKREIEEAIERTHEKLTLSEQSFESRDKAREVRE